MMVRLRHFLESRRSDAAVPHRNRYRERNTGQDRSWMDERDEHSRFAQALDDYIASRELSERRHG